MSYTDAQVTFTFTGDTANITQVLPGVPVNKVGTARVNVAGIGTASFTDAIAVFDNPTTSPAAAGFTDFTNDSDVLNVLNDAFATYGLNTSIGPESGGVVFGPGEPFPTTLGAFEIDSIAGNTAAFAAVLSPTAVPEPASLTLLGIGAAGLLGYGWRRQRVA
jgi:hypothetical protein